MVTKKPVTKTSTTNNVKTSVKKTISLPAGAGSAYFFLLLSLFIVGITFANIIDYWIADRYFLPLHQGTFSFFMGLPSYAKNISWQLIASIVAITLFLFDRRNLKMSPPLFKVEGRRKLLRALIIVGALVMTTYLVTIIYSYFSGISEPYGLIRVAVALGVLALGIAFSYAELTQQNFVVQKLYVGLLMGLLALGMLGSVVALQSYGSPDLMRQVQKDLQVNKNLKMLEKKTLNYYLQIKELPQDLKPLEVRGNIDHALLENLTYKKLGDASFEVCAEFKSDWKAARRTKFDWKNDKYKKGLNCRKHFVKKEKDGHFYLKLLTEKDVMASID